jgi:pilus assembly protein CpaB
VLRKPGEQNDPVVETIAMNDLRYNMYGGARYPAPAVVGSFGGAVAGSMQRSAAVVSTRPAAKVKRATGGNPNNVDVYHGTKLDQVKVGG